MKEKAMKARKVMRRWAPVRGLGYAGIHLHGFFKMFLLGCIPAPFVAGILASVFGYIYWHALPNSEGSILSEEFRKFLKRKHTLRYDVFGVSGQKGISLISILAIVCFLAFVITLIVLLVLDIIMYSCNVLWDRRFKKLIRDCADDGMLFDDWAGEGILEEFDRKDREAINEIRRTNRNFQSGWSAKLK